MMTLGGCIYHLAVCHSFFSNPTCYFYVIKPFFVFVYLCWCSPISSNLMFSLFFVFLQVRCLDFTDFGSIQIPSLMPRICVWKGDMVKHLSDMTIGRDGKYGCLTVSSFTLLFFFTSKSMTSFV